MNDIQKEYYVWLCERIGVDQITKTYWNLAKDLHHSEFRWSVPNDDNRAYEARNLREKFCEELDIEYDFDEFPGEVSLLEVIVGLAYRCESIMEDQPDNLEMRDWFWKMMENCSLDEFDDDRFDDEMVKEIIRKIVNRGYGRNGKGGLFPLRRPKKDQRKVELWYQMSEYLVENYYSDEEIV